NQTIDDVIVQMDQIMERCMREHSKLGYFATLYRDVTVRVRDGIAVGRFENGPRMERLDVVFAHRYLNALDAYWRGDETPRCWLAAFRATQFPTPVILQHLLLGINAHINFDLGIAAAQIASADELPSLKRDFAEITVLLNDMLRDVQVRIGRVSPLFHLMDEVGGRTDEQIGAFAMQAARDLSWRTAEKLVAATPDQAKLEIFLHDRIVTVLGYRICFPSGALSLALATIRAQELNQVPAVMAALRM
ncbi:MAG: DUF5995 family protein, partial [Chloroflexota bacterium]